jgi:hypothetical protein
MIKAFHTNSTRPFLINNSGAAYYIEDFELLTTVLSALMWRKLNGSIKLYTDKTGKDYYQSIDILDLWDAGINTAVLENISEYVNPQIFWACAKIFALQAEQTPVAMIDMDLIVWKSLLSVLTGKQLAVIHREELMENVYLAPEILKKRKDYQFDAEWDWTALPCNMSFAYFADPGFKKYYTDCSIDFMSYNNEYPQEMVSQMVFAEQRIVAMCAKKMTIPVYHFLDHPFQPDNQIFTHLWGAKKTIRNEPEKRKKVCCSLLLKIKENFPEYYYKLSQIEVFTLYINS